jgi:DNA repair protein RecO (recombination protein O)
LPVFKVTGVVLRAVNYRDYDRILTLFTRERGLVTVSARGVRRTNSRWRAGSQLFAVGAYLLYARGTHYYLSQVEVESSWYELRNDPGAMMHATFVANVVEAGIVPDQPNEALYALLLRALALYCYSDADVWRITGYALVNAMRILGFEIRTGACARCKKDAPALFSLASGGTVCTDCRAFAPDAKRIKPELIGAISALSTARADGLLSLDIGPDVFRELLPLLVAYAQHHLERNFKSASLLYTFFP